MPRVGIAVAACIPVTTALPTAKRQLLSNTASTCTAVRPRNRVAGSGILRPTMRAPVERSHITVCTAAISRSRLAAKPQALQSLFAVGVMIIAWMLGMPSSAVAEVLQEVQSKLRTAVTEPEQVESLLEEYTRLAIARASRLAANMDRQSSSREMISVSHALPDPMVGVMYQSIGAPWKPMSPMSMIVGEFSQPIPGVGKRAARRDVARAEVEVRKLEGEALQVSIAADMRRLLAELYATDREEQILEAGAELVALLKATAIGQAASGKAEFQSLARADLEASRVEEQLMDVRAKRTLIVEQINQLTRRQADAPVPRILALPTIALRSEHLEDATISHSPLLKLGRSAISLAERRHESAIKETNPNFLIGVSAGATVGSDPVVGVRVAMEIPAWRGAKQRPMIRSAQHEVEAARNDYTDVKVSQLSELRSLIVRFHRDEQQIRFYRESIIPKAEFALTSARNDYVAGRGPFATVVEDFRLVMDAQVGLSKREAERMATWAAIRALTEGSK